jgi:MFS family permease
VAGSWKGALLLPYTPILVARVGSGAGAFLVVKLASGGHLEAGAVVAAYPFLEAAGAFIAGRWSDLLGRKRTLVAGYVARSVAMLLLSLAFFARHGPWLEAVLNGIIGFTTAFIVTASLTMVTDLTNVRNRGIGMGGFELVNLASYGAGYLSGCALYDALRGPGAYLAVALATALSIPLFAALLPETAPAAARGGRFLYAVLPHSALALMPIWFALTAIIGLAIFAPRAMVAVPELGSSIQIGALYAAALAALGLGAVFFGRLADAWGRLRVFRLGLVSGLLAISALNVLLRLGFDIALAIIVLSPLLFLTSAIGPSILALVGDEADIRYRGTTMGIYSVVLGLGIGAGSIIGGVVASLSGERAIAGIACAALLVYASMFALHVALVARWRGRALQY